MLHSSLAIFVGFAAMVAIVIFTTAIGARFLLGDPEAMVRAKTSGGLPLSYLVVNLAGSAVAASVGGFLTARIAGHDPVLHGGILAGVMVIMSIASMKQAGSTQPRWYQLVLATAMPLIAVLGAYLAGS